MIYSREEFKNYILRSLGAPVIKINVAEEQLEDRVDEALDYWQQYHNESMVQMYLKQRVTPSEIHVKETFETLPIGEIRGIDSHARADVSVMMRGMKNPNRTIYCKNVAENSFIPGEKITIGDKTFTISEDDGAIKRGIIDERKIKMPPWVIGVTKIQPFHHNSSSNDLLSVQAQVKMNIFDIYDLTSTQLIYYEQMMEHLSLLNFELNANPSFEFNRHEGYVYPTCNWSIDVVEGDYMILQVYRLLDPKKVPELWNNTWLKRYAIALVKVQFANNLKKYGGIQLAGGVTLNGAEMYQEGIQEKKELEEELYRDLPPSAFFIG